MGAFIHQANFSFISADFLYGRQVIKQKYSVDEIFLD